MKIYLWLVLLVVVGCSPSRRISRDLQTNILYTDHFTGVVLYDPDGQKTLIAHNADKPFTPASNTKLFSFYAGLLTLHDSLPAFRYVIRKGVDQADSLIFWGTGNPLALHPDLPDTTLLAFLRKRPEQLFFSPANYSGPRFGAGWAWDDYNDDYSPELASLPLFGNVARFTTAPSYALTPRRFADSVRVAGIGSNVRRNEFTNQFTRPATGKAIRQDVPFRWSPILAAQLLADTLHRSVGVVQMPVPADARLVRGYPTDSLYKRMLHVSDNQFAEQVLFMASAERSPTQLAPLVELRRVADSLHIPANSARWVDGSGLSRYNAFTPNVLIGLLKKIKALVPQERLFTLLPAAGQSGTLRSIRSGNKPYVFAKSGSMTGVYNLSGYLLTQRGKLLYFSIMHNNFTQPVGEMRRRTGDLLMSIHGQF
ncbi:D-alanyl-D-alanine carboxypeptidase/D-alanyl-D-alanine-endopeptidase [Fibrella forsythiae]|uniref:D-alanyl-D-alanine carboxypeptidase n=1 Tax=Fibrella forsythiae TaxID=2817061 RepID=A0ABS3JID8_9BACT|nr:D-alanyl-D-alanine carboxypeptidase [Fibrella forsythiae]MBO0949777.1 D-alanyl-D-alanine carboxypeptidase [Fibrella forsythiae]